VLLEYRLRRHRFTERIVSDMMSVIVFADITTFIVFLVEDTFNLSQLACREFYDAWRIRPETPATPKVLLVAGLYGAWIGLLVMFIVTAYHKVGRSYEQRQLG
jgi:hypothetical protein